MEHLDVNPRVLDLGPSIDDLDHLPLIIAMDTYQCYMLKWIPFYVCGKYGVDSM